jgi:hemoglobin-like flavoprotein
MEKHGSKVVLGMSSVIDALGNMDKINQLCENLKSVHAMVNLSPEAFVIVREGVIMTLKAALGEEFTDEAKLTFENLFNMVRNIWVGYDVDSVVHMEDDDNENEDLHALRQRIVQHTWKLATSALNHE